MNAALSFGAMIPVAGWASAGGKLALKGNDLNQVSKVVSTEKMASIYSPIYQDVANSPLGKTQNQLDILTNTHYQLGTPNALAFNMPFPKTDIPTSIKDGDVDVKVEIKNVDVGAKGTGKSNTEVQFTKEQLAAKPSYSPAPDKWIKKDGTVKIDKDGIWVYTNKKGETVRYPDGYQDFTEYAHTTVKPIEIDIASPTNRPLDYKNANIEAGLSKDSTPPVPALDKPPVGYIWHHHQDEEK